MLTFLRKIRKSLIESGSARRYFVYAIGEIALVVIGILIALQINNWNEARKDRALEKKVIKDIVENLQLNKKVLSDQINEYNTLNLSYDIILDVIQNERNYHDSLDYHFHKVQVNTYHFDVPRAGYEGLKNVGFEIVQNDIVQKEIINLFEVSYAYMLRQLKWGEDDKIWKARYMDEQFYRPDENRGGTLKPFNFQFLINDPYYFALINKYRAQRSFFRRNLEAVLSDTEDLTKLIGTYYPGSDSLE